MIYPVFVYRKLIPYRLHWGGGDQVVWRLVSGLLTAWDTMLSASGSSRCTRADWGDETVQ